MEVDIVGYIAGTLTTLCFVPQAYKIIIHKNCEGLSAVMYTLFTIGILCWLTYGILLENIPMIIFNIITFILSIIILFNIIKQRNAA